MLPRSPFPLLFRPHVTIKERRKSGGFNVEYKFSLFRRIAKTDAIQAHEVEILTGRDVPFSPHVRRKCKGKRYIRVIKRGTLKLCGVLGKTRNVLRKF